jgi:Tfp pilus assembly protein PilX
MNSSNNRNRSNDQTYSSRRQGAVSVWAIVCLLFVTSIGITLARMALLGSRQMVQERRHSQADWLAQAGWSLAIAQLQDNADYQGQIWNIPATEFGGADSGRVRVEVSAPSADSPETRTISVIAEFPADSTRKVQVSRRGTWRKPGN